MSGTTGRPPLELLTREDAEGNLDENGLELLADCARWAGRGELLVDPLERAHRGFVASGDRYGAARTALGLCNAHADVCNEDLAGAWWHRASDLLEDLDESSIHGLHAWFLSRRLAGQGDQEGQEREARRALEVARRQGDRNVEALALIELAHVATVRGETSAVSDALERATSLALSGEIGLMESGMVFCSAIWSSRSRGDWNRAQQWTDSANRWVDRTRVSYFPALCKVHRAEVRPHPRGARRGRAGGDGGHAHARVLDPALDVSGVGGARRSAAPPRRRGRVHARVSPRDRARLGSATRPRPPDPRDRGRALRVPRDRAGVPPALAHAALRGPHQPAPSPRPASRSPTTSWTQPRRVCGSWSASLRPSRRRGMQRRSRIRAESCTSRRGRAPARSPT